MSTIHSEAGDLSELDTRVLALALRGLPLVQAPYAALARELGLTESQVLGSLDRLETAGVLKRFGLVVLHRELGYRANGMCVFDVSDERAAAAAARLKAFPFVTLCYRRARRPPEWRYNLYCMIHGTDREQVLLQFEKARSIAELSGAPSAILFSRSRFKQCAGRYVATVDCAATDSRAA